MKGLASWFKIKNAIFNTRRRYVSEARHLIDPVHKPPEENVIVHYPVMANEVVRYLKPEKNHTIVDMTFGIGGHSEHILKQCENIKILALDRDPLGYENACKMAENYPGKVIPLLGKFSDLPLLMKSVNMKQNSIDGFLFDFGCSAIQFNTPSRGFDVSKDGPLDMRMDGQRFPDQPTAKDVLALATEEDLIRIFKVYGEEKLSKQIARGVIDSRYMFRNLETTSELVDLVNSICGDKVSLDILNRPVYSSTKVFQALRIFVNNELNEINHAMHIAQRYLKIGGRVVSISFNSLEDTIVKRHIDGNIIHNVANPVPLKYSNYGLIHNKEMVNEVMDSCWEALTKHVVLPSLDEIESNPRSRLAKLRAAYRIK